MSQEPEPGASVRPQKAPPKWLHVAMFGLPAVLLAVFILLNQQAVRINFLLWQVNTSLVWALMASSGLGFLIGYLVRRRKAK
jgi:uncharacterized integral membrane protein